MQITLDTENLTDTDKQVLTLLGGGVTNVAETINKANTERATATKAVVKKAAAAPKAEAEAAPAAEPSGDEDQLEVAVALATALVSNGKANRVKLALADNGATRVGLLDTDKIPAFVEQLTGFAGMSDDEFKAEEDSRG